MDELLRELMHNEEMFLVAVITAAVVVISITKAFFRMVSGLATERTRREIAAYIAEGSMTPEQGQRILNTKKQNNGACGCG